jgi:hyperosmotically inducible periplasmic protein
MSIRTLTSFGVLLVALAGCEPRPADTAERGVDVDVDEHKADRPVEPDNTARNVRDRDDAAKTPFDQAENGADIALTAAIRREILKTDGLSTNADNVKIITAAGRVTLRGVVEDQSELDTVKAIATRLAGSADKVDVQLEIDPDDDADKAEDGKLEDDKLDRDGELDGAHEGDLEDDARPRDPVEDPAHR